MDRQMDMCSEFIPSRMAMGANRNTVSRLKALAEQRHLVLHGAGRGVWYGLN